ncbi:MAG: hypothetical protein LIP77_02885, partial [Planctomycetes bacterium]|nr:hypothetical protein [Planctomycetota bacterium]
DTTTADDDSVAEVTIDEVIFEDGPPAPVGPPAEPVRPSPPRRPPRPGARGGRKAASAPKPTLRNPLTWPGAALRFALYSGMTRNSPLIVTLRLLAMAFPVVFALTMSWYAATRSLATGNRLVAGGVLGPESPVRRPTAGGSLALPVPAGFVPVTDPRDFPRRVPYLDQALKRDEVTPLFAATHSEYPGYYLCAGFPGGAAALGNAPTDRRDDIQAFITRRELDSALAGGDVRGIPPFDRTEDSVCYGLMLGGTEDAPALEQYSCALFLQAARPLILTVGYSDNDAGEADPDWCRSLVGEWRDLVRSAPALFTEEGQ